MTDLLFKIKANNCEVDLPTITFFSDETDDSIILTLNIEKINGVITHASIKKAEYWFDSDWTKERIEIESYMIDEAIEAIKADDSTAFREYDGFRDDYERCGVNRWDFI